MNQFRRLTLHLVCTFTLAQVAPAYAQIAFPGAQGLGANSLGGRGGRVLQVTNLNDSGPGSLRQAIGRTGPRIVVFTVSGTIALNSHLAVKNPYITIAGQTAPGHGICIKDYGVNVNADHVIIRYLRVRPGDNAQQETDALWISGGQHIIIDHCSTSWGTDETLSVSSSESDLGFVTVQWCMITESLNCSLHTKGCHGYGSLIRGGWGHGYSFHHNLYAHHRGRSPRPGNYNSVSLDPDGFFLDFRNNVVYNWRGSYAGYNADSDSLTRVNFVGNYYVKGPESSGNHIYREQCLYGQAFFEDNWLNHQTPENPWSLVRLDGFSPAQATAYRLSAPAFVSMETDAAPSAFQKVLSQAGVNFPKRDSVDVRVIQDVLQQTGGLIDDEEEVGAWPDLLTTQVPADRDVDGMPDAWELALGLDPNNLMDAGLDRDLDGYTNIEEYINWLPLQTPVPMNASSETGAWEFVITALARAYVTRLRSDKPISPNALARFLTEDIQLVTSSGHLVQGKDSVVELLEQEGRSVASQYMTLHIDSNMETFKWLNRSAIVTSQTTLSGLTQAGEYSAQGPQTHSLVFEQILGQWYLTHAHTTAVAESEWETR